MNIVDKIICGAVAVCVLGALVYYLWIVIGENHKQAAYIDRLETQLNESTRLLSDANAALRRQNEAVKAAIVDTVTVIKQIEGVARDYGWTHKVVREKLEKDSTCENKLVIIDALMCGFHGVRAEGRNEN